MLRKLSPLLILLPTIACSMLGAPSQRPQPRLEDLPDVQLFFSSDGLSSCWQGLRPGETDVNEVRQLLATMPFAIVRTDSSVENSKFIFARHQSGYSVSAVIRGDVLHSIELGSTLLRLTIGELIATLDEPGYVAIGYDTGGETIAIGAEMTLFYPNQGFVFHLAGANGLTAELKSSSELEVCISEDALVSRVEITEVGSIEDMLGYLNFPSPGTTVTIDRLREWSGFGCIVVPYP